MQLAAPAEPVLLPRRVADEVVAAVGGCARQRAAACRSDGEAWVLVDDDGEASASLVRDSGRAARAGPSRRCARPGPARRRLERHRPARGPRRDGERRGGASRWDYSWSCAYRRGGGADEPRGDQSRRRLAAGAQIRVVVADDHPMWRDAVARDLVDAGIDGASRPPTTGTAFNRTRPPSPTCSCSTSTCRASPATRCAPASPRPRGDPHPDPVGER